MSTIIDLQKKLDTTPYKGKVAEVFSSSFGIGYQVGKVILDNGDLAVIKIKDVYRNTEAAEQGRDVEYLNLQSLSVLQSTFIPRPLYHSSGLLLISYVPGKPLAKVGLSQVDPETCRVLGKMLAQINSLPVEEFPHLTRFNSYAEILKDRIDRLYAKRLALNVYNRSFYDLVTYELTQRVSHTIREDVCVVWRDANRENILIGDNGKLSGLIDFEDMVIAPRFVQLRAGGLEGEYLDNFREGYGADQFDASFDKSFDSILKVISLLNGIYLAHTEHNKKWLKQNQQALSAELSALGININHKAYLGDL